MKVTIARARPGDEKTLAYIQTESWRSAFAGILDEETLAARTKADEAEAMYKKLLEEDKGHGYILSVDGKPHCIAYWDAARDESLAGMAELICIHSLPDGRRKGRGTMMLERVLKDMKAAGYAEAVLWVFKENLPARAFYESNGFAETGTTKTLLGKEELLCVKRL